MDYRCRIGKITPKDKKVVVLEKPLDYKTQKDVVEFVQHFLSVLRDESVRSVGVVYETDEGTGSNFIITPPGTFSTLIAQTDVLKHRIIRSYLDS